MGGFFSSIRKLRNFEVNLWTDIQSRAYDGESSYKTFFYDKLKSDEQKIQVKKTLVEMLRSDKYSLPQKALISYVCADIGVIDALSEVDKLRNEAQGPSYEKQMLTLAHEALSRGRSVHDVMYGNHD